MEIVTSDFPSIQSIVVKKGATNKVELTINKATGDITLTHSHREHMLSSTWYNDPLFIGTLTEHGLDEIL